MAITNSRRIEWHLDILPVKVRKTLDLLSKQNWLKRSDWYLAGGTALALKTGHRVSQDLDFFTPKADFRLANILKHFEDLDWRTNVAKEGTIYGELSGVKVSFIAYPFFLAKNKPCWYGSLRVLHPLDIAVMKVVAISQRGRKRDFFDLYWCAKELESLQNIIERLPEQYPDIAHNYHHILKSLEYFTDAENEPEPKIFFNASWKEVKKFFEKEAVFLAKKLIGLK